MCRWIEKFLVHAEGDYLGTPFRLRPWQKAFIWRAYELKPDGSRQFDQALLGLPKGNGKTELAAAIAVAELAGPVCFDGWESPGVPALPTSRTSPDIPIAAASFEQADTLFGAAKTMIKEGPLSAYFDCFDTEVVPKNGNGRLYRVAAVAGTNDGGRPTFFVEDELHEWIGRKERVHLVLSNSRAKRSGGWQLGISTAGNDPGSLLGRLYRVGKEGSDPRFLFQWWEGPADADLSDPEQRKAYIFAGNPAAGDFLPFENIDRRYGELGPEKEHEFRRYYGNEWRSGPDKWISDLAWSGLALNRAPPPEGAEIVLGFDGSYSRDSTGLVGCTLEDCPHLFVVESWERPEGATESWRVDVPDVENQIQQACDRWQVRGVGCDPFRWQRTIAVLLDRGLPMVEWPSHTAARMAPACAQFEDAVDAKKLSHDGDERLARHISNCVTKIDSRGKRITKIEGDIERRIDLGVCAVIAYDMAVRQPERSSWKML